MADDLHGFKESKVPLLKEDSQDRLILLLKAQGMTNRKVAQELGVSENKISYTTRQTWFMKSLIKLLHEKGEKEIEKIIEICAKDAIAVAHDLMMNSQDEKIRASACFQFINAHKGQKIIIEDNNSRPVSDLNSEIAAIEEDLDGVLSANRSAGIGRN